MPFFVVVVVGVAIKIFHFLLGENAAYMFV